MNKLLEDTNINIYIYIYIYICYSYQVIICVQQNAHRCTFFKNIITIKM